MSFWMFLWPLGEKLIFLDFLGSGTQIEGKNNIVSTGGRDSSSLGLVTGRWGWLLFVPTGCGIFFFSCGSDLQGCGFG